MVTLFLVIAQVKYPAIKLLQTYSVQNFITMDTSLPLKRKHSERKEIITH